MTQKTFKFSKRWIAAIADMHFPILRSQSWKSLLRVIFPYLLFVRFSSFSSISSTTWTNIYNWKCVYHYLLFNVWLIGMRGSNGKRRRECGDVLWLCGAATKPKPGTRNVQFASSTKRKKRKMLCTRCLTFSQLLRWRKGKFCRILFTFFPVEFAAVPVCSFFLHRQTIDTFSIRMEIVL